MKPRFPAQTIPGITSLPPLNPSMRIGLFGGSFNPPHAGHRLVALECLKRLGLDAVWLLVSPGNPLKSHSGLRPLAERVEATRKLLDHPRLYATGFEAAHGFRYTYDTLRALKTRGAGARFVWIMGADNLRQFDRWERWRDIARLMPMAVYARPGAERAALASKAALALSRWRLDPADAPSLADADPPAWVYLTGRVSPLSSTRLRALITS
jgi:nicotinate-nucleotide adenylyltransferase